MPVLGPALAGGALAAILSSAAAGAAVAGLAGALIGLGIPKEEAEYYQREFEAGRVVVTVAAEGREPEARLIIQRNGGFDQYSRGGMGGMGRTSMDVPVSSEEMAREKEGIAPPPGPPII
jgi:pseudouridine-5'-phosphate glycosidase